MDCVNGSVHNFYRTDYVFARDLNGVAFRGHGWATAPKYTRAFCQHCGQTIEIQICPPIEVRKELKRLEPEKLKSVLQPVASGHSA
jgi:hypothetical protein